MRKCCLPKIIKSNTEKPSIIKSVDFSNPFNSMLSKFKLKGKNSHSQVKPSNNTAQSKYLLTELGAKKSLNEVYLFIPL